MDNLLLTQKVNAYFSMLTGCLVDDHDSPTVSGCEVERRQHREEGYGRAWPVYILKRDQRWWISAASGLLESILPCMTPHQQSSSISDDLADAILQAVPVTSSYWRSLVLMPAAQRPQHPSPPGVEVHPIKAGEQLADSKGWIPEESVAFGTAIGVYVGSMLVGFAEATPLPTVTPRFGIMLVGIEVHPVFRQQGLAKAALSVLTDIVLAKGMIPLYSCSVHNLASQKTALSCGYTQYGEVLGFYS